jgi:hypothetical protein
MYSNYVPRVLHKGKGKSRAHNIHKSSGLVKGDANENRETIARQAMLHQ